jgi:D-glycero-alpha-D-manno-heptose-7-phosphate kinase
MLYTGIVRKADNILSEQSHNAQTDQEKRASLRQMVGLAEQMREALLRNDLGGFGELLHAGWQEKRKLASGISNPLIDEWYERARAHGAIGGKILGAGGGGFLLLYAPLEKHPAICEALPELRPISFRFEPQGSKLIYVEENGFGIE